jgi:hypothetical protein
MVRQEVILRSGLETRNRRYGKEHVILSNSVANSKEATGRFAFPEEYVGYEVLDPRYQRIGSVEEILPNARMEPEYIRVRVGLLGLRSVLIPVQSVWMDKGRRILQLRHRSHGVRRVDG